MNEEYKSQFDAAITLFKGGRTSDAVDLLRRLLLQHDLKRGRAAVSGYLAGIYLYELNEVEQAEALFREAVRLAPRSDAGSLGLFHSLMRLGRAHEALEEARRFLLIAKSAEYEQVLKEIAEGLRNEASETNGG